MIFALLFAGADPQVVNGWSIDRSAERCIASRRTTRVGVEIKSSLSSDFGATIQLAFPGMAVPPPDAPPPAPIGVTIASTSIRGMITYRDGMAMAVMPLSNRQADELRGLSSLDVYVGDNSPLVIDLSGTPSPVAALKTCGDGIIRGWGADPAALVGSGSPARTASWFRSDDYPADARRAGIQGRAVFLVSVDREGKPTDCRIVRTTGSASLDKRTCDLVMIRGTYPATSAGPSVRWAIGVINWLL